MRLGLNPDIMKVIYRTTPLGWAANFSNIIIAVTLLNLGANINFCYYYGYTPLSVTLFRGSDKIVELLL